jgi:hypothetical protein
MPASPRTHYKAGEDPRLWWQTTWYFPRSTRNGPAAEQSTARSQVAARRAV